MGISKANRIGVGNTPPVIENLGDGSSYYNFNAVVGETEDGMPSFDYEQIRFDNPTQTENIAEVKPIINRHLRINGREEI